MLASGKSDNHSILEERTSRSYLSKLQKVRSDTFLVRDPANGQQFYITNVPPDSVIRFERSLNRQRSTGSLRSKLTLGLFDGALTTHKSHALGDRLRDNKVFGRRLFRGTRTQDDAYGVASGSLDIGPNRFCLPQASG